MWATPYADPSKHLRCLLWQLSGQYSFKALSFFLDNYIDWSMKIDKKVYSKNLLIKSSENDFIFLPALYLIMWLMKVKKNFEKIAILKTRELVSFWGVKTHFGKMMHFQAWKNQDYNQYFVVAFDTIKIFTNWAPQNDHLNLSFVKDVYVVAKKMTTKGQKMTIFET